MPPSEVKLDWLDWTAKSLPFLRFKGGSVRLAQEFWSDFDARLRGIVIETAVWVWQTYGLETVVTNIYRTRDEQLAVNPDRPHSSHRTWRAIDLRNRHLPMSVRKAILLRWHEHYGNVRPEYLHVVDIPHGTGPHFHLNINLTYALDYQEVRD